MQDGTFSSVSITTDVHLLRNITFYVSFALIIHFPKVFNEERKGELELWKGLKIKTQQNSTFVQSFYFMKRKCFEMYLVMDVNI